MQVASGRFCDMLCDRMGIRTDADCLRDLCDWNAQCRASRGDRDKKEAVKNNALI